MGEYAEIKDRIKQLQLDEAGRAKAYRHAMQHIASNDFMGGDVTQIEQTAHTRKNR